MNHFCTITTYSHLYKVSALAESLRSQQHDFLLHVLIVDGELSNASENCRYWKLHDLKNDVNANTIISKYKTVNDKLRWSLKPVFIKFLLEQDITDRIIYLDNDLFFYSDYQFLFDLLTEHSFLLTPHYYKSDPKSDQNWFEANFRVGLFNAGFIGANKNSLKTLQWWADCCEYRCEKNTFRGLFDDQKYLDLVPVIEEGAHIVRHKGCNVASWNTEFCERKMINGELRISEEFPVVFIHFNTFTIREIIEARDALLLPFYTEYEDTLKLYKLDLCQSELYHSQPLKEKLKYYVWKLITDRGF